MSKNTHTASHYVQHPLNLSKSKSAFSFQKSSRFPTPNSYSPNKFYQLPTTLTAKAFSMGSGNKTCFENKTSVDPGTYRIPSQFDPTPQPAGYSFGISRQSFYKGKSFVNPVGPGSYKMPTARTTKKYYMGERTSPLQPKHNASCYLITSESVSRLSNHKAAQGVRMTTQYYPKSQLHAYDNGVPGPGSYQKERQPKPHKRAFSGFGVGEKIHKAKPSEVGPGSYIMFSQFGQPR